MDSNKKRNHEDMKGDLFHCIHGMMRAVEEGDHKEFKECHKWINERIKVYPKNLKEHLISMLCDVKGDEKTFRSLHESCKKRKADWERMYRLWRTAASLAAVPFKNATNRDALLRGLYEMEGIILHGRPHKDNEKELKNIYTQFRDAYDQTHMACMNLKEGTINADDLMRFTWTLDQLGKLIAPAGEVTSLVAAMDQVADGGNMQLIDEIEVLADISHRLAA